VLTIFIMYVFTLSLCASGNARPADSRFQHLVAPRRRGRRRRAARGRGRHQSVRLEALSDERHRLAFTRYCFTLLWESIIRFLPPTTCKAYPIAILLHDVCAIYAAPSTPPLYGIYHTILVVVISCEGQDIGRSTS